jgi:hypothetical protein
MGTSPWEVSDPGVGATERAASMSPLRGSVTPAIVEIAGGSVKEPDGKPAKSGL